MMASGVITYYWPTRSIVTEVVRRLIDCWSCGTEVDLPLGDPRTMPYSCAACGARGEVVWR